MQKELTKNIKILYVEDDDIARENGIEYLENYFDKVYEAKDALSALKIYNQENPHIIISDIQMPKLNGLEFIRKIRQKDKQTQIIILSAFSTKEYLFEAIELQLVKYLTKPICENELKKALEICINTLKNNESNIIHLDNHTIFDTFNQVLLKDKEIIKLRKKELDLLSLLIKNKNRFITYEEIENFIWQDSAMTKDALKTLIKNLKTKIPKDLILNISKLGYKIEL
ncbi:DNA-binding response regulator [Halarcobacter mediterraneus]|uniref:DNA-binding response regulator n=1 Tax=Halarcobacter mediterraneus TaxID=2023153 RepID=A0A4Q1ATZ2_9BACT|nr:response regulator [Halarcobacter mediterraneus]RXK12677.1 DNA-binding response regulator [Halarcobacter mediterraneus]